MSEKKSFHVCVFCGARPGHQSHWSQEAYKLGRSLALREMTLVYGGGHTGLMGMIADACLENRGSVIGVIPESLQERELAHQKLTELYVVKSMHARKALMAEKADAFIAMAGGFGTMDELCEIITWRQLGIHNKPIGILNTQGYFQSFIDFAQKCVDQGFISPLDMSMIIVSEDVEDLLNQISKSV